MKDSQFCSIHVVRSIFIAQIAQSAKNGLCTHIRTVPDLYGTLVKYQQNVQVLDWARIQRLGRNWASGRGCETKIFEDQQVHVDLPVRTCTFKLQLYLPVDLQPYY